MSLSRFYLLFVLFVSLTGNCINSEPQKLSPEKTTVIADKSSDKNKNAHPVKRISLKNRQIISLSIVMVVVLFFLFYFSYQNNKLKQKIKRKDIRQKILLNVINAGIDRQEEERKEVASFLHDNINSLLSSVGLHLNTFTAKNNIKSEEINKAKAILQEAHDLARNMSHDLVPTLLVRFGLIYALEDLCERNSNSSIEFNFSSTISTEKRFVEKFEIKLYFIVTELFNNIIKHSNATKAKISLSQKGKLLTIIIHDNGKGFNTERLNSVEGFGLNRIRVLIKKYKGNISITSKANEGTTIEIHVPTPL